MSTSRKIQLALVASLLWSSTSVSSFAATNTIIPEKHQSVTVKVSVESIPSRQLNLTPDTNLIAGEIRDMMSRMTYASYTFAQFDNIWKNPADRKKRLFDYCNAEKDFPVAQCFSFLQMWGCDMMGSDDFVDFDEIDNIIDEAQEMTNKS